MFYQVPGAVIHSWTILTTWLFSARDEVDDLILPLSFKRDGVKEYLDGHHQACQIGNGTHYIIKTSICIHICLSRFPFDVPGTSMAFE